MTFEFEIDHGATVAERYAALSRQAKSLLAGETNAIALAANFSALVYHGVDRLNWAGFYMSDGEMLVVGPFQGKPACIRIPFGRGVCGRAAVDRETLVVADVDAFPGHIPCDSASRSEIVVPIIINDTVFGVFDVDSPEPGRFTDADRVGMEQLVAVFRDQLSKALDVNGVA